MNSNSIAKAKVICVPLPLCTSPCPGVATRCGQVILWLTSPVYGLVYGVYIYIYICVYAQIYVRGTFVYCASFVFVVNKLKMRPNWQRRHSICMRGVRGTLDRQPRLEELCAHGQHKRCFKQPPLPHPSSYPSSLLSPYQVISQTLSHFVRHRWMRFALPKHFVGCQATPNASFPPSTSCSWLYLSLFSHIEGEIGCVGGGGMLGLRPTWLEFAKGSKCCMALGASPWPQIVSSSSTAPQIGIAVRGRTTQREVMGGGEGNANANTS